MALLGDSWGASCRAVAVLVLGVGLAGCSSDPHAVPEPVAATGTSGVVAADEGTPFAGSVAVSAEADGVISAAALSMPAEQVVCVAERLDADPVLRDELGSDPESSQRYLELLDLVSECARVTTFAVAWADGLQTDLGGVLSDEQLVCLRDAAAGWTQAEYGEIVQSGVNPGSVVPGAAERVYAALDGCGVDRALLASPG